MKKAITTLMAVGALVLGTATSQAQWTYVDAIDFTSHSNAPAMANTWLSPAGGVPWVTVYGNGTPEWRFRNTGPGAVAWDPTLPGGAGSAYAARNNEGDPPVYTIVPGLIPNQEYSIRLYGTWTGRNNTWGLSTSMDSGTTWSGTIDRDTVEFGRVSLGTADWVDNSSPLGASVPFVVGSSTDTRGYMFAGSTITDGAGNLVVGVRGWPNTVTERGVYDGIAFAEGLVPEPTTFALLGLGGAAMLIFRRRQ